MIKTQPKDAPGPLVQIFAECLYFPFQELLFLFIVSLLLLLPRVFLRFCIYVHIRFCSRNGKNRTLRSSPQYPVQVAKIDRQITGSQITLRLLFLATPSLAG